MELPIRWQIESVGGFSSQLNYFGSRLICVGLKVESSQIEINHMDEVLGVAIPLGDALDILNRQIQPFGVGIGGQPSEVGFDAEPMVV